MLLTVKLVLLGVILLTYTLLNSFFIAISQVSEMETEEQAQEGNKSAKKILKFIQNEHFELDRVSALKTFLTLCFSGFSVLCFASDMRIFLCKTFLANTLLKIVVFNCIGAVIIICLSGILLFIIGEVLAKIMALKAEETAAK